MHHGSYGTWNSPQAQGMLDAMVMQTTGTAACLTSHDEGFMKRAPRKVSMVSTFVAGSGPLSSLLAGG